MFAVVAMVTTLAVPASAGGQKLTGVVQTGDGLPLADVTVSLSGLSTTTGTDGRFTLWGVGPGTAEFERVAYQDREISWDGAGDWLTVHMAPDLVRSVHVAGWVAASDSRFQDMLDIGATSAVNGLVLDIRDTSGFVYHTTAVTDVADMEAGYVAPYDLAARTSQAHAQGFHVTARMATFVDGIAGIDRPWWAVEDRATEEPLDLDGLVWLDPTDVSAQQYAIDLALEACAAGVDEVEFDYAWFPPVDPAALRFDGVPTDAGREAAITDFIALARSKLEPLGCATAVDVPGWLSQFAGEEGTGIRVESIAAAADVITPIVFPSNYLAGDYGIADPLAQPGAIVSGALAEFAARTSDSTTPIRPWIQDFAVEADAVTAMIEAADGAGLGWMVWNASSFFSTDGIPETADMVADESVPPTEVIDRPPSGFFDVPATHTFTTEIGWMDTEEISTGCDAPWGDFFCPTDEVSRGQMAAFLARALDLAPPVGSDRFTDDDGSPFEANIEAIAAAGITLGCTTTEFCPEDPVNRAQMATFIVRALDLDPIDDPDRFEDDDGSPHEANIAAIADVGITLGCHSVLPRFCPGDTVNRGQMSAFLYRALAST